MQLSQNEIKIIEKLRSLKPYQKLEVMADGSGQADTYVITEAIKQKLEADGRITFLHVTLKRKDD